MGQYQLLCLAQKLDIPQNQRPALRLLTPRLQRCLLALQDIAKNYRPIAARAEAMQVACRQRSPRSPFAMKIDRDIRLGQLLKRLSHLGNPLAAANQVVFQLLFLPLSPHHLRLTLGQRFIDQV